MSVFVAVSLAIVSASIFGLIARLLRQPLLVGYLFAGFVLAAFGVFSSADQPFLENMAQFGITFLLFLVGLQMNLRDIPKIGKVALVTGLGQIAFTSIIGYLIASALGFGFLEAAYIAAALTFSSTIIVVNLLSEKKDLQSLYGKISVGFLLVQDFVAIILLILLSGFQVQNFSYLSLGGVFIKGLILALVIYALSRLVLTKVFDRIATVSSDFLFVASIAWALLVAAVVSHSSIGFSIEIGGFLAGLALAGSTEHLQIASRVKPLRDFFIVIFFFLLGTKLVVGVTGDLIFPAIILSLFVLIGNPLIVLSIMGLLGYRRRTSFLASVTVAQISEFSFILVALGDKIGHIGGSIVSLVTLVGVITMTGSTYLIINGQGIYRRFKDVLGVFERKQTKESALTPREEFTDHIVLIGADRTGRALLPALKKQDESLLVIDFNPQVVEKFQAEGIEAMYGDVSDSESLDVLNLGSAKILISTINSREVDLLLLEEISSLKRKPASIFVASTPQDALRLYEAGADYVLVPRIVSGEHLAHVLRNHGINKEYFEKLRNRHFDRLVKERF